MITGQQDPKDKLESIFAKQIELQARLGNISRILESESMKQKYINQMILAVIEEAVEIMRETKYKNPDCVEFGWKKTQCFNKDKMKEEIADLLHFVVNLCIAADMGADELFNRYCNKQKENIVRKESGY